MTQCFAYTVHMNKGLGPDIQVAIVARTRQAAQAWLDYHYGAISTHYELIETVPVHVVLSESP